MRLEILDDGVLIWETGRSKNKVEFDSREDLTTYKRRRLSVYEDFLRKENQIEEANIIKKYLGKILRYQNIPQMIPTGNYKINMYVDYLYDKINGWVENDGLDLDPDFQRAHVWSKQQRVAYIEFLMQGGRTAPIYFNHVGWFRDWKGDFVIVDGKQRLTSIMMFMNNEFPIFKNLDEEGVGFYAKEFNDIPCDIEICINNLQTRKQVLQWYLEMNQGQVAHTTEELNKVKDLLEKQ